MPGRMLKFRIDQPEAFLTLPFRILPVNVLKTTVTLTCSQTVIKDAPRFSTMKLTGW